MQNQAVSPSREEKKELEVRQVTEKEIWIGENRICLGDDRILYINACGEIDRETAQAIKDGCLKLENMIEGKSFILIDINKTPKTSSEARKIFKEELEKGKARKVAYVGMHTLARGFAIFLMKFFGKNENMNYFKTREEALLWLRDEK